MNNNQSINMNINTYLKETVYFLFIYLYVLLLNRSLFIYMYLFEKI